jgi:hypothetical protein
MSKIELTFIERLSRIQQELVAPKTRFNTSYKGFYYRNQDDILEAVKPLLAKYELCLKLSDEFMEIGDAIFCKATAKIFDFENSSAEAYGWSGYNKNPAQAEQNAGKASTYSRKYALNGLFLIDDSVDPDMEETTDKGNKQSDQTEKKKRKVLVEGSDDWNKVTGALKAKKVDMNYVESVFVVNSYLKNKLSKI